MSLPPSFRHESPYMSAPIRRPGERSLLGTLNDELVVSLGSSVDDSDSEQVAPSRAKREGNQGSACPCSCQSQASEGYEDAEKPAGTDRTNVAVAETEALLGGPSELLSVGDLDVYHPLAGAAFEFGSDWLPEERELAATGVKVAIRENRRFAQNLGWRAYETAIESYLGRSGYWRSSMWPEADFPRALYRWQRRSGLKKADGMLGPESWKRMRSYLCLAYEPGEAERSLTKEGHLVAAVLDTKAGLLVADFGVASAEVKGSVLSDPLLTTRLRELEREPPTEVLCIGFTDCVGEERDNLNLRRERAMQVGRLFGPKLRPRVRLFAGAMGKYVASDNLTPKSRALNRSVLVQWRRSVEFSRQDDKDSDRTETETAIRCALILSADMPGKQGERIRKMVALAERLGHPRAKELWFYSSEPMLRYFDGGKAARAVMTSHTSGRMPFDGYAHPGSWRVLPFKTLAHRFGVASACGAATEHYLIQVDEEISSSFAKVQQKIVKLSAGGGGMYKGEPESFLQHIHSLRADPSHLYSAYR